MYVLFYILMALVLVWKLSVIIEFCACVEGKRFCMFELLVSNSTKRFFSPFSR